MKQNQNLKYNNRNLNLINAGGLTQNTMKNQNQISEIIKNATETINAFDMQNFGSFSWGRYQGSQGAWSEDAMIKDAVYNQEAWDFVQEHMEELYQEFYIDYMERYVYPEYLAEVAEEEGISVEEAEEECDYSYADDIQSIYFSIQHFFAENVYDAINNAPIEVEYVKHSVSNEQLYATFKVTHLGVSDEYSRCAGSSPEPYAGTHPYQFSESDELYDAIYEAYQNVEDNMLSQEEREALFADFA